MVAIWIAVGVVAAVGAVAALALGIADKYLSVQEDPRIGLVTAALPGANCGGCGRAGCEAYARDMAEHDAPCDRCTAGGPAVAAELARLLGREPPAAAERKVAVVLCTGGLTVSTRRFAYNGVADCGAAQAAAGGDKTCAFGCLGYGSCARVCPARCIRVEGGVAVVDRDRCLGCGACVAACPRGIIALVPASHRMHVLCRSHDKGASVHQYCSHGCIGCGLCTKFDKTGTISLDNALAVVDYSKPPLDDPVLVDKCPGHCLVRT